MGSGSHADGLRRCAVSAVHLYQLDITVKQGRNKVREMFMKNAHVTDPRVIDMLVIKVQPSYSGLGGSGLWVLFGTSHGSITHSVCPRHAACWVQNLGLAPSVRL